jgi:hypothetical protein
MITYEEFEKALTICIKYQNQVNEFSDKINDKMKLIKLTRSITTESKVKKDGKIKQAGYISPRLKRCIGRYAEWENVEIVDVLDLLKIDIAVFKKHNLVGKGMIDELNAILKALKS